jgi:hypothetical protein
MRHDEVIHAKREKQPPVFAIERPSRKALPRTEAENAALVTATEYEPDHRSMKARIECLEA